MLRTMAEYRFDPAILLQIGCSAVAVAVAWGNASARLDAQREAIAGLERAISAERAERLAEKAQAAQARMLWLMQRSGRRLDVDLTDVAKSGGTSP